MVAQKTESTLPVGGKRLVIAGRLLFAALALSNGGTAHAQDRYRCIPTDGSPSFTTPGSCRGDVIRREPLSYQEIAQAWEIETRGREFTRCTAADGRYSNFVSSGQACPSPTDKRTVEYAKRSIEQQKNDAERVARVAASVGAMPPADFAQGAAGATNTRPASVQLPPAPAPAPAPVVPLASPASAPSVSAPSVLPLPKPRAASTIDRLMSTLGWLVVAALAVVAVMAVMGWRSRRSASGTAGKLKAVRKPAQAAPATHSTPPATQASNSAPPAQQSEMDMQAQTLLAMLENANAAATISGGLAFLSALRQARLDYSLESVGRVDQLLAQIKTRFAPHRSNWHNQPGTDNFLLLLGFYLGTVISRLSHEPVKWYNRQQAAPMMPSDMPLPDASWSRLVGVMAASPCVPIGVIEDSLFPTESVPMTCKAYVERFIGRLGQALTPGMDENKRCATMLHVFFSHAPMFGGLAFAEQLRQAKLDYSLDSLQRLDRLLRFLHSDIKPPYTEFINRSESQNFMRFAAFYIGMTVARLGAISVKWLSFEQAKKDIPELEFQFETSSVCLLSGRTYFPLGLVTELLLQPQATRSIVEWAKQALQVAPPPMLSVLRSTLQATTLEAPFDAALKRAIEGAGFMAAWAMFMVEGGSTGALTVYVPTAGEGGTFRDFSFYGDEESAFQAARERMQTNPDGVPFQVMSFDGYANLHTGRTDALTIELSVYGSDAAAGKPRFKLVVVCPYRNAGEAGGFAIFSPKVSESSAPDAMHDAISRLFYQGVASYKSSTFDWFKQLDERI